uniref:Uncharacterized protein n=1 Tax=uncultured bacterium contig00010 TaxID=1181502 RepID=A0A806KAF6_9BACT|nr:hypothetical protein [uncultured bacterium contig00010]
MNNEKLCPVCGSSKIENIIKKESIHGDLGKELTIDVPYEKCIECGSEGNFSGENEKAIEKALSTLNEEYIDEVLNFFDERKISYAGIERAVGLPQRTLTKWKNRNSTPTASGIALLKYLRLFPWLIEVAENKFDNNISQKIFMGTALEMFVNSVNFNYSAAIKKENSTPSNNLKINLDAESLLEKVNA